MNRITWKTSQYGTEYGYVNKIRMFEISHSMERGAGSVLRTRLPGWKPELATYTDRDVLKSTAERVLERFVERIGAIFPDPEPEPARDALSASQDD